MRPMEFVGALSEQQETPDAINLTKPVLRSGSHTLRENGETGPHRPSGLNVS
jgi:hypothetical protein